MGGETDELMGGKTKKHGQPVKNQSGGQTLKP
jgi:hypothetical protein